MKIETSLKDGNFRIKTIAFLFAQILPNCKNRMSFGIEKFIYYNENRNKILVMDILNNNKITIKCSKETFSKMKNNFKKIKEEDTKKLIGFLREALINRNWKQNLSEMLYKELSEMINKYDGITNFYDLEDIYEEIKEIDVKNFSRNIRELEKICPKSFQGFNKQISEVLGGNV